MTNIPHVVSDESPLTLAAMERARRTMADPNAHCDECGATAPKPHPDAPWSAPDNWRVIWDHGVSGPDIEPRPDSIDSLVPANRVVILCQRCLPPMSSFTEAEQRYLFGLVVPAAPLVRAEPWGPVRPGVNLPCLVHYRRTDGSDGDECTKPQGHAGRHSNGTNRSWDNPADGRK